MGEVPIGNRFDSSATCSCRTIGYGRIALQERTMARGASQVVETQGAQMAATRLPRASDAQGNSLLITLYLSALLASLKNIEMHFTKISSKRNSITFQILHIQVHLTSRSSNPVPKTRSVDSL